MQTRELQEFAERRSWTFVGEYVDRVVLGSKDSRPALNQLLDAVHKRMCGIVLLWKMDRWARWRNLVNSLS